VIGARTATTVVLSVAALAIALVNGRLTPTYLGQLQPESAFVSGLFACLAGTLFYVFWHGGNPSVHYLELKKNLRPGRDEVLLFGIRGRSLVIGRVVGRPAFDFPPAIQRILYVVVFLGIALFAFDNRTTEILLTAPAEIDVAGIRYCEEDKKEADAAKAAEEMPGCKLVLRAYQLGFVSTLGTCDPNASAKKGERVCTDRRRDEPYAHYLWRSIGDDFGETGKFVSGGASLVDRLTAQFPYLEPRFNLEKNALSGAPRAAHVIWTNLPEPHGFFSRLAEWFDPRICAERAQRPERFLGADNAKLKTGYLLEQTLGQLIFASRFRPIVGFCQEYQIHWDAPKDTCQRLVKNPGAVLQRESDYEPIAAVVERWRSEKLVKEMHVSLQNMERAIAGADKKQIPLRESPPLEKIISFNCLMVEPGSSDLVSEAAVRVFGEELTVRTLTIDEKRLHGAGMFHAMTDLLTPNFRYGRFHSAESKTTTTVIRPEQLPGQNYLLSQLELLVDADFFLGHDWLFTRGDLLAVYPFHVHFKNYVEIFRRQYQLHRGRL
jgi:hypothetical protein